MNRRRFLVASGLCTALLAEKSIAQPNGAVAGTPFTLSASGCGRATGYAETNKIVHWHGKTHVAYLDSDAGMFHVRIRTLDHASGRWSAPHTVGDAYDNHGGPALAVDSRGHLHIAYYPHHHPMRYRKSIRANDASEWSTPEEVGERLTYPTLVIDTDDTIYLTARQSDKAAPWLVNLYSKKAGGAWKGPHAVLQAEKSGYAHFMEALAWSPDGETLHLATRIHDGKPARGHTIGYVRSADKGMTWTKYDGTPVTLPATAATVDIVRQDRDGVGHGLRAAGIAVAPDGRPFVLCSDQDSRPDEAWIAYPGKNGLWQERHLREAMPSGFADWGIFAPGGIAFNDSGELYVVLTMIKPGRKGGTSGWGHSHCEIIAFVSKDLGQSFAATTYSQPDDGVPRWLPNMERSTGHNTVHDAPGIIYTEGVPGAGLKDTLSNKVQWLRP